MTIAVVRNDSDIIPSDEKDTCHLATPNYLHHLPQLLCKVAFAVQEPAFSQSLEEVDNEEKLMMRNSGIEGFFRAEAVAERMAIIFPCAK